MELAVATKEAKARGALTRASRQLLLLIALGYGIACIVPACLSFVSRQVNDEEPRSGAFVHASRLDLHAELACESARPRLWERSACHLPK